MRAPIVFCLAGLCLAWAIIVCATPGRADYYQSQPATGTGQQFDRPPAMPVACRQDDNGPGAGQMISARFDRADEPRPDRRPGDVPGDVNVSLQCD
jgi:hypothetical protein